MSDPRDDTELELNDQEEMRSAEPDAPAVASDALGGAQSDGGPGDDLIGDDLGLGDEDALQTSTGGGMGPESYPPEDDEDYQGNGAGRGPS